MGVGDKADDSAEPGSSMMRLVAGLFGERAGLFGERKVMEGKRQYR
jgi:hypothetical protein